MSNRSKGGFRSGLWIGLALGALCLVTLYESGTSSTQGRVPRAASDRDVFREARSDESAVAHAPAPVWTAKGPQPARDEIVREAASDSRLSEILRRDAERTVPGTESYLEFCIRAGRAYASLQTPDYAHADRFFELVRDRTQEESAQYARATYLLGWNRIGENDRRGAFAYFDEVRASEGATRDQRATSLYQIAALYESEGDWLRAKAAYKTFLRKSAAHLTLMHPYVQKASFMATGDNLERAMRSRRK